MADTHGEYAIAVELLKKQKVIDANLKWSFGKGRLAVLGDVFDRGPNQTEILWLLYSLEAQAKAAGGAVYVMLGNHESMALGGDERYLSPEVPQGARCAEGAELRLALEPGLAARPVAAHEGRRDEDRRLRVPARRALRRGRPARAHARAAEQLGAQLAGRSPARRLRDEPEWAALVSGLFPEAAREAGSAVATRR